MFFDGTGIAVPRYTLWGWGCVYNVPVRLPHFPRAHRALKGWNNAAPKGSPDCLTWPAVVLIAEHLHSEGTNIFLG